MNEFYENIANKTECSECDGKEMGIAFIYEGGGAVKKQGTTLGMQSFTGAGNLLMIYCKSCGFVAKNFIIGN